MKFLTVDEARRLLNVSRAQFYRLTKRDDFPRAYENIGPRSKRWAESDLIAWMKRSREAGR